MALGFKVNMHKSHTTCIRCDYDTASLVANHFSCIRKDFPIMYLGLPLTTGRLRRSDIWPLIDKFSGKLKAGSLVFFTQEEGLLSPAPR
jgi:hypothetical protein